MAEDNALKVLCEIIECPTSFSTRPPLLKERLEWYLSARCADGSDGGLYSYERLCSRSAKSIGISVSEDPIENEIRVIEHFTRRLDEALDHKGRRTVRDVLAQYDKDGKHKLIATFSVGGLIALVKFGGFGSYISSSTVLGAATSALNITLPFSIYMGMSQALSSAIGPAAWIALAAGAFQSLRRNADRQLVPLVIWTYTVHAHKQSAGIA